MLGCSGTAVGTYFTLLCSHSIFGGGPLSSLNAQHEPISTKNAKRESRIRAIYQKHLHDSIQLGRPRAIEPNPAGIR